MSHRIHGWPSWTQEELETPGAGPSGSQSTNDEQEPIAIPEGAHVERSCAGLHVPPTRAGYSQSSEARMRARSRDVGSQFPVVTIHPAFSFVAPASPFPAPSVVTPPSTFPAPIAVGPPTWASTWATVPASHRWAPHAAAPTPTPIPDTPTGPLSPAPEELPSPATPAKPPTTVAATSPPAPPVAPALHVAPAPDAIAMARVIPTDAQRSTYSALEGAVRPFKGPWVDMARTIVVARLNPLWDPSDLRRERRKRRVDAEEQPPQKRARVERGVEDVIIGTSVERSARENEEEEGISKAKIREGEGGVGSEGKEKTGSEVTRYRHIAPKPATGPVEAAGGLRPMPVVIPQVHGNALQSNIDTSTTSTHRVDNPAGEFVVEPVPLPSGGPSTSTPADDQDEAGEAGIYDHNEHQHQLVDGSSLSKREAAVVIDEKIYGGDPLRCLACNNMSFGRKYDRRRHVVTIHYLNKVPCDWCDMFFYARRDGVTRHKDENCPARDFEDRHTNPMRWFMAWLSGPSGWR